MADLRMREIMTTELVTCDRNDPVSKAHALMDAERIRHILVKNDDGVLIGVLSQRDMFAGALAAALGYGEIGQQKVMETLLVKEVMSTHLVTAGPDDTVRESAQLMHERKIGCLPVVDEKYQPVGVVTEGTFVKLIADGAAG